MTTTTQTITNRELQSMLGQLKDNYDGDPWYGRSLLSVLNEVTALNAWNAQINSNHTNMVLLRHIINWRLFTISRFEPDAVATTKQFEDNNWQINVAASKEEWLEALQQLAICQQKLLEIFGSNNDEILEEKVPARATSFRHLLNGIIQHDIYHIGQIMLTIK